MCAGWVPPRRSPRTDRTITSAPRPKSTTATAGASHEAVSELSTVAPAKAPMAPGTAMRATSDHETLPNFQWDSPEVNVVPISARCTLAEETAGAMPLEISTVLQVTPKAMPSAPSTSCPNRPAKAKTSRRRIATVLVGFSAYVKFVPLCGKPD